MTKPLPGRGSCYLCGRSIPVAAGKLCPRCDALERRRNVLVTGWPGDDQVADLADTKITDTKITNTKITDTKITKET